MYTYYVRIKRQEVLNIKEKNVTGRGIKSTRSDSDVRYDGYETIVFVTSLGFSYAFKHIYTHRRI